VTCANFSAGWAISELWIRSGLDSAGLVLSYIDEFLWTQLWSHEASGSQGRAMTKAESRRLFSAFRWNLWRTKWHYSVVFSVYLGFPYQVFHQCSVLSHWGLARVYNRPQFEGVKSHSLLRVRQELLVGKT